MPIEGTAPSTSCQQPAGAPSVALAFHAYQTDAPSRCSFGLPSLPLAASSCLSSGSWRWTIPTSSPCTTWSCCTVSVVVGVFGADAEVAATGTGIAFTESSLRHDTRTSASKSRRMRVAEHGSGAASRASCAGPWYAGHMRIGPILGMTAALGAALLSASAASAETYTLADCLRLADGNAPQLKIAAEKVAQAHAQLDEVRWIPFSQWVAVGGISMVPEIKGSPVYSPQGDVSYSEKMGPAYRLAVDGAVPLYTFGKMEHSSAAATAFVDVVKAEGTRGRDLVRHDVRRAFYGVQLARDGRYLVKQMRAEIRSVIDRFKSDENADESDVTRLELYYFESGARLGEMDKLERMHLATLRLLTGVEEQKPFEIPEDPLAMPPSPLLDDLVYLKSARIHRPEFKQLAGGMKARSELAEYNKSRMFPDIGMYLGAGFATAPYVSDQTNAFIVDNTNFNRYGYAFAFRWSPELLPNVARITLANAQLAELRNLELYALGGVGVEVVNAHAAARDAETREKYFGDAEKISKRWVVSVAAAIGAGLRPDSDLFDPFRAYLTNRYAHLVAIMDVDVARSQLALATGDDSVAP